MNPWLMALRPKTLSAAVVPIFVATALVAAEGKEIFWWVSGLALLSALLIQIGTNLVNDAIDFKKGADTEERIGPKRVTQSGLLSSKTVMMGALICLLLAAGLGIPLVIKGGWPIVVIGLFSLFFAYAYTGGPYPLAYRGLGDLFVILFFGLMAVGGVYYLHTGTLGTGAWIAGLQVGLLSTVLIAINNLRDREQDAKVNKRTLVVRFGHRFGVMEVHLLYMVAFFLLSYWIWDKNWLAGLLPLVALPISLKVQKGVLENQPGPIYNKFLAKAAGVHMLFGLQLSLGLLLGTLV